MLPLAYALKQAENNYFYSYISVFAKDASLKWNGTL